jgi:hypothetical protein
MGRPKKPEPKATRVRRSNNEILKISAAVMREMRDLAIESRMPLFQIHNDVLNIGLCEVRRILYDHIITARKEIQERLNVKAEQTDGDGGPRSAGADPGKRSDSPGSMEPAPERIHAATESPGDFERLGVAPELSGFSSEDAESVVVDAGQDRSSGGDGPG